MRGLLRYLVVLGALVAVAWASVSTDLGGKTLYGHLRSFEAGPSWRRVTRWMGQTFDSAKGTVASWLEPEASPDKKKTSVIRETVRRRPKETARNSTPERREMARKVSLLERASKDLGPGSGLRSASGSAKGAPKSSAKARVDERISPSQKKSLERLVEQRIARP